MDRSSSRRRTRSLPRSRPPGRVRIVLVEPGEYRERLVLTNGVRVVSRVPRGATIRLPGSASEGDPAVVADGVSGAELAGFRIVGDAATPLGTGIFARNTDVAVVDVEVVGAANVAIESERRCPRDDPGQPHPRQSRRRAGHSRRRIAESQSESVRAKRSVRARRRRAHRPPRCASDIFRQHLHRHRRRRVSNARRRAAAAVARDNWFADAHEPSPRSPTVPRGRRGRG